MKILLVNCVYKRGSTGIIDNDYIPVWQRMVMIQVVEGTEKVCLESKGFRIRKSKYCKGITN
jgi:hypothetical protein